MSHNEEKLEVEMIRNKISIERQINERQYQFVVPYEAPLNEVLMIVEDIKKYVVERLSEAEKQHSEEAKENQDNQ